MSCHTSIKNRGLSVDQWPFPTVLTIKTSKKHRSHVWFMLSDIILARWQRPVASSEALDPPSGNAPGYVPAHCHDHQNGHLFRCICWLLFVCLLPWRPLGRYVASSRPMAASSCFRNSPGHAALSEATCIAPAHPRGHWNGRRTRCICSSLSILSLLTITVAKDHVMVH